MAKKTPVETPEVKPTEAQEELKALKEKQVTDYIGEEPENPVEKKAEELKEEPKVEPKEEKKEEQILELDPEQLKQEVAEKAKSEAVKAIQDKYNLTEKQAESLWVWEKEGRNPKSYEELAENIAQVALSRFKTEVQKEVETKRAQEEEQKNQIDTYNKTLNTMWDEQIYALRTTGKLPKVVNPKDENDEGVKAQKDFWAQLHHFNQEKMKEGKAIVTNLIEFYTMGYQPPRKEVDGADAPISGPTAQGGSQEKGSFTYDDIRSKSFYDILR